MILKFSRKAIQTLVIIVFFSTLPLGGSLAYDGIVFYGTKLSTKDRYSSKGLRLTSLAQILQQDRANVHAFKKVDEQDEPDIYFTTSKRRRLFERLQFRIEPELKKAILAGEELEVTVYIFDEQLAEVKQGLPPKGFP